MDAAGAMFALNMMIALGYVVTSMTAIPGTNPLLWTRLRVRRTRTRVAGFLFFVTCAITHVEIGLHALGRNGFLLDDLTSFHMFAHMIVQVVALYVFIHGVYDEVLSRAETNVSTRS